MEVRRSTPEKRQNPSLGEHHRGYCLIHPQVSKLIVEDSFIGRDCIYRSKTENAAPQNRIPYKPSPLGLGGATMMVQMATTEVPSKVVDVHSSMANVNTVNAISTCPVNPLFLG